MIRRIAIALLIGAIVAVELEGVNGFFAFLLPPLIVITPLCLIAALIVAMSAGRREQSDT